MTSAFIDDGQTFDAYIQPVEGLYPEVRFTYRPMTVSELGEHTLQVKYLEGVPLRLAIAKRLESRISNWNLGVPEKQENLMKLQPLLFHRIWAIVTGDSPSDPDPEGKRTENRDEKNS